MPPRYRIPRHLVVDLAIDLLRGSSRSFARDARICVETIRPAPVYSGLEHIPDYPCLITINHYSRPGFQSWWLALGVNAVIPAEVHWLMTAAWTFPGRSWAAVGENASRVILERLTRMYAFISMPPMPPRPEEMQARAQSVRRLLESVRSSQPVWIGIAPEGQDTPGGILQIPPQGSGRLLLLLAGQGLAFLPAGIYEDEEVLRVCFGEPYRLEVEPDIPSNLRDSQASRIVMRHLAKLLPDYLRGPFAESQTGKQATNGQSSAV